MEVRFQPTFDELVYLSIYAARRPVRAGRAGWLTEGAMPLVLAVVGAGFLLGLSPLLIAVAFILHLDRVLPGSTLLAIAGYLRDLASALWLAVGLLVMYAVWERFTLARRYRRHLAGYAPLLEQAGELTIALTETGVELHDTLHRTSYPWGGIREVVDSGRALVIFPLMGNAIGMPYRVFASPAEAQAWLALANQYLARASSPEA